MQRHRVRSLRRHLTVSTTLLGLTSRLADNSSANVIGLALGTGLRCVTYERFRFAAPSTARCPATDPATGSATDPATGPVASLAATRPAESNEPETDPELADLEVPVS